MKKDDLQLALALRLLADAWDELQRTSSAAQHQGPGAIPRVPDLSLAGAERNAVAAKALLARITALDEAALPHPVAATLRQARFHFEGAARQADWYWLVLDPTGLGFFGLFAPTAYCGGFAMSKLLQVAPAVALERSADLDRYLGWVGDLAVMVEQMSDRTIGQRERGILVPRPQLPSVRGMIAGLKASAAQALGAAGKRVPADIDRGDAARFRVELERRIADVLSPAFERLAAVFDASYEAQAPEAVGMDQYPGGAEVYAELVKRHTTLELTPTQVHNRGLERMAHVQREMYEIRAAAGFEGGDAAGYLARAAADPRFSADTVEGVTAVFQRYIDRMECVFDSAFLQRPTAPHGVAALPPALEASMTFGFYDVGKPGDPVGGRYMFNAANLTRQPLLNIASLTYHELVPGHHLHMASQGESESLHPIARYAFCNAFNEGWAEYAATLAGELGMYEEPEERYGRLIMDAFLTCRLVVDTGMNSLGWSLEQARDYMRRNGSMAEAEVLTESLRYSCDIPAQSLAYKLGDTEMLRLREQQRSALGDRFDLREFHTAVLGCGAMPIPDLEWSLGRLTEQAELTS